MARLKNQVLSVRTSEEVKSLLRLAADKEHRSLSSMMEHMVYDYAQRNGIVEEASISPHIRKKSTDDKIS